MAGKLDFPRFGLLFILVVMFVVLKSCESSRHHNEEQFLEVVRFDELRHEIHQFEKVKRQSGSNYHHHHNHNSHYHPIHHHLRHNFHHAYLPNMPELGYSRRFTRQTMTTVNMSWPVKRSADVEGDIYLGGMHMVHEREDSVTCGPIMPQGGVQALETMLFTIDYINDVMNKDGGWISGVKLGAHILDDCDKDTYGLEQAVDFIKGSISNIGDDTVSKCKDGSSPEVRNKVISGVVGAASSVTSIQVANLLRLFKIPQVSFFSTSPELSNKQRFEYFSRTIPSDLYQTIAMAKIVEKLGWKYLSIVYEESNYGIKAFEELERLFTNSGICVAVKEKLTKDSGVAGAFDYNHIVAKLLAKPKARGVIVFGSDQEVAELMKAVKRMNATGHFNWIGSDGWSARALVSDGHEAEVEGTLSVQPQANPVIGFEDYFLNLTVRENTRNPWFVEFWEDHFKCRYPGGLSTPHNQGYHVTCTGDEKLTRENTQFEAQLQFVSDAVMAFAHAFRAMHHHVCGEDFVGLCDQMKPIDGEVLLRFLRQVNFTGLSGDNFRFDDNGDGPARYNIIHYKQVSPGQFQWVNVGYFQNDRILLDTQQVQFQIDHPSPPPSVCSHPCTQGQMKKYVEGESCCWTCHQCGQYQRLDPDDETRCLMCPNGTLPDREHLECVSLPEEYLNPESPLAIGAMAFALVGIVITATVLGVYIRFNDTPVVRASGRELSYVLLIGLLLCYAVTFLLVVKPTDVLCGIQQFMIGLCFSVVYGALLTKTNRIARIFDASKRSAKRPNFISPKSQLIICAGLVFVQVLINVIWMLVSPPEALHHHPTREDNLLVCKASINASYMIAFTYPILLVVVCTVYAVLTRKIPEAFNESKFIGFSMYTTCVIWLAFIPIYFSTAQHVDLRITSMSFTISLSATVTIVCLFTPKLYIVLLHPEKNIRQSMMNQSKYQNSVKTNQNGQNNTSQQLATKTPKMNENGGIELHDRVGALSGQIKVASNTSICPCCQAGCKAGQSGNIQTSKPAASNSSGGNGPPPRPVSIEKPSPAQQTGSGSEMPPIVPEPSQPNDTGSSEESTAAHDQKSTQTTPVKSKLTTSTQTMNNFAVTLNSLLPPLTQEVPDVAL